ncbi:nitroreductase family protein [Peredibacter sp. HCB2-198]|uniref:nitroreductase family protein n=1 Tax=Peredibacter sp. HCB2-198 TaxID=3383025 RepID=UPI0038B4CD89
MSKLTSFLDHAHISIEEYPLRNTSPEAFDNIIQNRRSVRVYTDEKVPEEVVQKVLEWGLLAPNSSNLQCWEFYWVRNPDKKKSLIDALFNQPAARTAQEIIVAVAHPDQWKKTRVQMLEHFQKQGDVPKSALAYYQKLVPIAYSQGFLGTWGVLKKIGITAIGFFKPIPREPTSWSDMKIWAVKSTALACENIMLGFSAYGYDTCPMEGYDSDRIKKILGLPRKTQVVMAISVGKRDKKGVYGPRIRMPKEQFIKVI